MIFYFTATGNSKFIADKIAAATGDDVRNIADCVQNEQYLFEIAEGEKIGFVVPVYYYGIPIIVDEFLSKLKLSTKHDYYSYVILNCGGTTANAECFIKRIFKADAIFGIKTVDNYVPLLKRVSDAEINERLDKAEKEIDMILKHISNKDAGTYNKMAGLFPRLVTSVAYPIYKYGRRTKRFQVNDKCISCGLCERICPRKVIKLKNAKPVWETPQCEICLGCLHRCPTAAINYGKSARNGRYVNPRTHF